MLQLTNDHIRLSYRYRRMLIPDYVMSVGSVDDAENVFLSSDSAIMSVIGDVAELLHAFHDERWARMEEFKERCGDSREFPVIPFVNCVEGSIEDLLANLLIRVYCLCHCSGVEFDDDVLEIDMDDVFGDRLADKHPTELLSFLLHLVVDRMPVEEDGEVVTDEEFMGRLVSYYGGIITFIESWCNYLNIPLTYFLHLRFMYMRVLCSDSSKSSN